MKKTVISLLVLISMWLSPSVAANAVNAVDFVPKDPTKYVSQLDYLPAREENVEMYMTRSSYVYIDVNVVMDEEWREQTNASTLAKNAIESADDYLWDEFRINFYNYEYANWNSNDNNSDTALLNEAISEHGLNGNDYMMAFTGQDNNEAGGWGRTGQAYCLVINQNATANKKVARHEMGHTYGLSHCSENCLMNSTSTFYNYYDVLCEDHYDQWESNSTVYGTIQ